MMPCFVLVSILVAVLSCFVIYIVRLIVAGAWDADVADKTMVIYAMPDTLFTRAPSMFSELTAVLGAIHYGLTHGAVALTVDFNTPAYVDSDGDAAAAAPPLVADDNSDLLALGSDVLGAVTGGSGGSGSGGLSGSSGAAAAANDGTSDGNWFAFFFHPTMPLKRSPPIQSLDDDGDGAIPTVRYRSWLSRFGRFGSFAQVVTKGPHVTATDPAFAAFPFPVNAALALPRVRALVRDYVKPLPTLTARVTRVWRGELGLARAGAGEFVIGLHYAALGAADAYPFVPAPLGTFEAAVAAVVALHQPARWRVLLVTDAADVVEWARFVWGDRLAVRDVPRVLLRAADGDSGSAAGKGKGKGDDSHVNIYRNTLPNSTRGANANANNSNADAFANSNSNGDSASSGASASAVAAPRLRTTPTARERAESAMVDMLLLARANYVVKSNSRLSALSLAFAPQGTNYTFILGPKDPVYSTDARMPRVFPDAPRVRLTDRGIVSVTVVAPPIVAQSEEDAAVAADAAAETAETDDAEDADAEAEAEVEADSRSAPAVAAADAAEAAAVAAAAHADAADADAEAAAADADAAHADAEVAAAAAAEAEAVVAGAAAVAASAAVDAADSGAAAAGSVAATAAAVDGKTAGTTEPTNAIAVEAKAADDADGVNKAAVVVPVPVPVPVPVTVAVAVEAGAAAAAAVPVPSADTETQTDGASETPAADDVADAKGSSGSKV